jgi:hypothetical protein
MSLEQIKTIKYDVWKEGPERQPIVFGMTQIHVQLTENYLETFLDQKSLDELGIVVSQMSLDTGSSDTSEAHFFEPLARHLIDELWAKFDRETCWPKRGCFTTENFTAAGYVNWCVRQAAAAPRMKHSRHWRTR